MPPAPEPVRIAMWSGPRNISTAMMRSFENREDTWVVDEPFYGAFLAETGIDHPLRAETLAAHPTNVDEIVKGLLGSVPGGKPVFYQKQMTHHMLPGFDRGWMRYCRNAFLIRAPDDVLASYIKKRAEVRLEDIGFVQQREMFDAEADRLGHAPPVIDGADVLANPRGMLTALCRALDIPFSEHMLCWPAGRRATDGAWAPAWYDAVERSTGFSQQRPHAPVALPSDLQAIADKARPHYERLAVYKLAPTS